MGNRNLRRKVGRAVTKGRNRYEFSKDLEIGKTYTVDKRTPVMPIFDSVNNISSMAKLDMIRKIKYLKDEDKITVESVEKKRNIPWYLVTLEDKKSGWINGVALLGQKLLNED